MDKCLCWHGDESGYDAASQPQGLYELRLLHVGMYYLFFTVFVWVFFGLSSFLLPKKKKAVCGLEYSTFVLIECKCVSDPFKVYTRI